LQSHYSYWPRYVDDEQLFALCRRRSNHPRQASAQRITFTSPLIFGVAHVHHLHEHINSSRRPGASYLATALTPSVILPGLIRSIFQFLYTSLFGIIAAFVYVRTSSLVACILAHSFCNWMGLPRFWGRVGEEVGEEMLDQTDGSVTDTLRSGKHGQRLSVTWTVAYYVVLFAGAIGFWKLRWSLTNSHLALVQF